MGLLIDESSHVKKGNKQVRLDIHSNQHIYMESPEIGIPEKQGKKIWSKVTIRTTTKGKLKALKHLRPVYILNGVDHQPTKQLLIIRKTKTKNSSYHAKYTLSNAESKKYSIKELAEMQAQRNFIERGLEVAKSEIGIPCL